MSIDEVIAVLHEVAEEMVVESDGTLRLPPEESRGDNLLEMYGFRSIDALEYLLAIEERLGVTFEDEDLSEEIVTSATRLAQYILERVPTTSGDR